MVNNQTVKQSSEEPSR